MLGLATTNARESEHSWKLPREVSGQDKLEVACRQIDETGSVLATKVFARGSLGSTSLLLASHAKGKLPRLTSSEVGFDDGGQVAAGC